MINKHDGQRYENITIIRQYIHNGENKIRGKNTAKSKDQTLKYTQI